MNKRVMCMCNVHVLRRSFFPASRFFRFGGLLVHEVMPRSDSNASKYHLLYTFQYSYAATVLLVISSLIGDWLTMAAAAAAASGKEEKHLQIFE